MDGSGETAAQRVTDLEAQLTAARTAAAAEAAAGAPPADVKDAAADAAAAAGASPTQAAQAASTAAAEQVAPGDGTRPQDGQAVPTVAGTGAVGAATDGQGAPIPPNPGGPGAAIPAAQGTAGDEPPSVLDLLKQTQADSKAASDGLTSPHSFLEDIRTVATRLVADGRIVEADLLTPTESRHVHATLIKVVGELLGKVHL